MDCRLEICCGDIESVANASRGGADRIELCSALELGGLTPSIGLVGQAVELMEGKPVHVLIRPRGGDFVYTHREAKVMTADMEAAIEAGATGIVFGALDSQGSIDLTLCGMVRERFPDVTFTFHRAFDLTPYPEKALREIIAMGYDYLLTSGQSSDALHGAERIARLVEQSKGRIRVMAGAGVTPDNIKMILRKTGVADIHASAKAPKANCPSEKAEVAMGSRPEDSYRQETSQETVALLKTILSE